MLFIDMRAQRDLLLLFLEEALLERSLQLIRILSAVERLEVIINFLTMALASLTSGG